MNKYQYKQWCTIELRLSNCKRKWIMTINNCKVYWSVHNCTNDDINNKWNSSKNICSTIRDNYKLLDS